MAHRYQFPARPIADAKAVVGGDGCKYRFTILFDGLIRYEWAPDGVFEDRASTFVINRQQPVPNIRVIEKAGQLEIVTDRVHLQYDKKPFSAGGFTVHVSGKWARHGALWRYGEEYDNLGGTARTLDGVDGRTPLAKGVISREGFAAIDDSKSMLFDNKGWIATRQPGDERIDGYLFAYGHDYLAAIKAFYSISGNQPVIPRWSLGNWWSRYYEYSASEYLQLMDRFRTEDLPFSVAVLDMDWHLVNDDRVTGSGWTGYTWNPDLFPNPKGFLDEMHQRGLKITVNDHPADGVRSFEDQYEKMGKALGRDMSKRDPINFDITDRDFCDAFFDILHRDLENQGVDFWWIDWQQGPHSRTPGVDPLWALNHYHFLDRGLDGKIPLTFSRFAGPGSHRYPIGFSGDTQITWASLEFQPEFTISASNIGYGWWSHDIGGHYNGHKDEQLSTRWLQYGVFSPVLRLHSSDNPFLTKEPWTFGVEARGIMNRFLRLRHRLVPYLYTENIRCARGSEPLVQPLYWYYPTNEASYRARNEFFFGSQLLVAPITSPRDTESRLGRVKAWFPPGRHVDIFSGVVYDGDRELWINRSLAEYPVFGREGTILPLDAATKPGNNCANPDAFEVIIVVGADGAFDITEDNGTRSKLGELETTQLEISYLQGNGTVKIKAKSTSTTPVLGKRAWTLKFLACDLSNRNPKAFVDRKPLKIATSQEEQTGSSIINLGPISYTSEVIVDIGPDPQLTPTDVQKHISPVLDGAYIDFELKKQISEIVREKSHLGVKVGQLAVLGMSEEVLNAFLEYLVADGRSSE